MTEDSADAEHQLNKKLNRRRQSSGVQRACSQGTKFLEEGALRSKVEGDERERSGRDLLTLTEQQRCDVTMLA